MGELQLAPGVAGGDPVTWVRKAPLVVKHVCAPPAKQIPAAPSGYTEVDGSLGDLWRCDTCEALWQVDYRWPSRGLRPKGLRWRPASWWQRLMHRKSPPPIEGGDVD